MTLSKQYRHVKRGTTYEVVGRASLQNATGQMLHDNHQLIVYIGDDGKMWAREESEFLDGRFESIAATGADDAHVAASDLLRKAIGLALECTPHICVTAGNQSQPVCEIVYDCGDPWEILRDALATTSPSVEVDLDLVEARKMLGKVPGIHRDSIRWHADDFELVSGLMFDAIKRGRFMETSDRIRLMRIERERLQGLQRGHGSREGASDPFPSERVAAKFDAVINWSKPLEAYHTDGRSVPATFVSSASGHTVDVTFDGRLENALLPSGYIGEGWCIRNAATSS